MSELIDKYFTLKYYCNNFNSYCKDILNSLLYKLRTLYTLYTLYTIKFGIKKSILFKIKIN